VSYNKDVIFKYLLEKKMVRVIYSEIQDMFIEGVQRSQLDADTILWHTEQQQRNGKNVRLYCTHYVYTSGADVDGTLGSIYFKGLSDNITIPAAQILLP
jgi:hypothetical protein